VSREVLQAEKKENGRVHAPPSKVLVHLKAVPFGHHHVRNETVEVIGRRDFLSRSAVVRHGTMEPVPFQLIANAQCQVAFVFHQEDAASLVAN